MIALLSATWDEISRLKRDIQVSEEGADGELKYKVGDLYGRSVVIAVTGVGIRRARVGTSFIIQKFKPRIIISAGLGGALSPDLKVEDIVLGESVISLRKMRRRSSLAIFVSRELNVEKVLFLQRADLLTNQKKRNAYSMPQML